MPANSIFSGPITNVILLVCIWWKFVHVLLRKRKQKGQRILNFAFSLFVFKWHHGSERLMQGKQSPPKSIPGLQEDTTLQRHNHYPPCLAHLLTQPVAYTFQFLLLKTRTHSFHLKTGSTYKQKWNKWNSCWITCKRSESAREQRIALYKSDQQQLLSYVTSSVKIKTDSICLTINLSWRYK